MIGHPGLHLDPAQGGPAPPGPDQAGGPDEERQGLLGGRQPRRQQVQIDVEERDGRGAAHPVQHRLGADQHGCRRDGAAPARPPPGPATSPTSVPSSAASSSRRRLTPTRSVFMRSRPQAAHTTGPRLAAARAAQHLLAARLCRRRAAAGAAGQLAAVTAGQQAGAAVRL